MNLNGFGWILKDLDGFWWIWLDLDGFGRENHLKSIGFISEHFLLMKKVMKTALVFIAKHDFGHF